MPCAIFTMTDPSRLSNRDCYCKSDVKRRKGNPKQTHCQNPVKLDETMAKEQNNFTDKKKIKLSS
jgi:hypothetical protein